MITKLRLLVAASGAAALFVSSVGIAVAEGPNDNGFTLQSYDSHQIQEVEPPNSQRALSASEQGYKLFQSNEDGSTAVVDTSFSDSDVDTRFMIASELDSVTLSWDPVENVREFVIYRGEVQVATVSDLSYVDDDVSPGKSYEYRIEALSTSSDGGRIFGGEAYVPESADPQGIGAEGGAQRLLLGTERMYVTYLTHIPQARVNVPAVGCSYGTGYEFAGDNRGWFDPTKDIYSQSSKTWVTSGTDWTSAGTGGGAQHIGSTKVYSKATGKLVAEKTATFSGDPVKVLDTDVSSSLDLRFQVRASNPFCTTALLTPYIEGVFTMRISKAGTWQIISGSHKLMPNHEIVIGRDHSDGSSSAKSIYRAKYANSTCLVNGACEKQNLTGRYGNWK